MAGQSLDFCDNDALSCHCQPYKGIKRKTIIEVIDTIMKRFIVSRSAAEAVTALS